MPLLVVPDYARYLWDWFIDLSASLRRVRDGYCEPFPPSEFMAWKEAAEHIVTGREYAILRAMDRAYCSEMNKELTDYQTRETERRKAEAEAAGKPGKRR